ncbi:uncharacterized protein FIESC28_09513 [Fusarium coffeatum]|uniref:Nephrocystin 3-like N-terminal domain-containing protein n=1 Tax=Fusarium coffeatum TaxID=231269 RepID=A0A366R268_9HYPO|nr:uncharacterized protein FIESC28_09513 [Fusarium coffeatum]RBR10305.1 hypothetical protein FIESC28_09513 [Fusarium coffeatum]
MATGIEALGAVSAVFQVILFSAEAIALCKKIYDGKPTANDDLEGHATQLQTEFRFVTDMQRKGNVISALKSALRASSHRKRIDRLELALSRHRHVMETEMLTLICSQGDAQRIRHESSFRNLGSDVQTLVVQIAQGYIKLEDLMRVEHQETRDMVIRQTADTQKAIKDHITTDVQRKEFPQSLRSPEMKKRYKDLIDSSESTFSRVFASYDRVATVDGDGTSLSSLESSDSDESDDSSTGDLSSLHFRDEHIDEAWASFVKWLRSESSLFCIQGKPGSGKSTLVKFIIDNPNTKALLC